MFHLATLVVCPIALHSALLHNGCSQGTALTYLIYYVLLIYFQDSKRLCMGKELGN